MELVHHMFSYGNSKRSLHCVTVSHYHFHPTKCRIAFIHAILFLLNKHQQQQQKENSSYQNGLNVGLFFGVALLVLYRNIPAMMTWTNQRESIFQ